MKFDGLQSYRHTRSIVGCKQIGWIMDVIFVGAHECTRHRTSILTARNNTYAMWFVKIYLTKGN